MKLYISAVILILSSFAVNAQDAETELNSRAGADGVGRPIHAEDPSKISNKMVLFEDSLSYFMDSLTYTLSFKGRADGNVGFIKIMKNMLKHPNSFDYRFDSLSKQMNIIYPRDKKFRIFNWSVQQDNNLPRYYAVMQMANGKIVPFIDVSEQIVRQQEDTILDKGKWFGAMYYNILDVPTSQGTTYFLLGFNGSYDKSDKKLIEAMNFAQDGSVVFGMSAFESMITGIKGAPKVCNRFIAEYQKSSKIRMNWDNEQAMIVYDHLESNIGDKAKRYTYVSDGTYDGLKWNGKYWRITPNAIPFVTAEENYNKPQDEKIPSKIIKQE